jgi:hypothetical protein
MSLTKTLQHVTLTTWTVTIDTTVNIDQFTLLTLNVVSHMWKPIPTLSSVFYSTILWCLTTLTLKNSNLIPIGGLKIDETFFKLKLDWLTIIKSSWESLSWKF